MDALGKHLLACRAVPLLELLVGDLALDKQLCELSALRVALERHQAEASKRQIRAFADLHRDVGVGFARSGLRSRHVVLLVVIGRKKSSNLHGGGARIRNFELASLKTGMAGRQAVQFRDREAPGSNPGPPTMSTPPI